ncbi:hypothetical protein [Nocardia jiangsuensis]|uniref:ESAT-6 protein secretion system EspG family protein n=1 Tax=Nocardia jiangsuensis TaxID=1691563 RepID=A0ABV8DR14_9NOCA
MPSEFDRALRAAHHNAQRRFDDEQAVRERAVQVAERAYRKLIDTGREAFAALIAAGIQTSNLVEYEYPQPKRPRIFGTAICVGISATEVGYDPDSLYICDDGRFVAGRLAFLTETKTRLFSDKKDKVLVRVNGAPVAMVRDDDWVQVSCRQNRGNEGDVALARYPDKGGHCYSVRVDFDSEEMTVWGFDEYTTRPFIDDIAKRVANTIDRRS